MSRFPIQLRSFRAALVGVLIVLTHGCAARPSPPTAVGSDRFAPEFTAQTLSGAPVEFGSLRGKVILLHLWAAWDCADELPGLDEIASRLSLRAATVVAVSIDSEVAKVERVAKSREAWNLTLLHDPSGEVTKRYDPKDFPAAYVIDRQGRVRYEHHGLTARDLPQLEAEMRQLETERARPDSE